MAKWEEKIDPQSGKKYWVDHANKRSQWTNPFAPSMQQKLTGVAENAVKNFGGGSLDDIERAAKVVEKLRAWYAKATEKGEADYYNRSCSKWIPELLCCIVLFVICVVCFLPHLSKYGAFSEAWGTYLVVIFVMVGFLTGPIGGYLIDKRFHNRHEMVLLKFDGCMQSMFVIPLGCLVGFGGFPIWGVGFIADLIDGAFFCGPIILVYVGWTLLFCWSWESKNMPTFWEVVDTKLIEKFEKKPSTMDKAKGYVTKLQHTLAVFCSNKKEEEDDENKAEMEAFAKYYEKLSGIWAYLAFLHPSRALTFAKVAIVHYTFDILLDIIADCWSMYRVFCVLILCLFSGMKDFTMQLKFCMDQRKRIKNCDYGIFDPPALRELKMQLAIKFNLPDLPRLRLPALLFDDLLLLLPDLPNMPHIDLDFLHLHFPSLVDFPDFGLPHFKLDFPTFDVNFPAFGFALPGFDLNHKGCGLDIFGEIIGDAIGMIMEIGAAILKINKLTEQALKAKAMKSAKSDVLAKKIAKVAV